MSMPPRDDEAARLDAERQQTQDETGRVRRKRFVSWKDDILQTFTDASTPGLSYVDREDLCRKSFEQLMHELRGILEKKSPPEAETLQGLDKLEAEWKKETALMQPSVGPTGFIGQNDWIG